MSGRNGATAAGRSRIAVLIPFYNEAITIADVVQQYQAELPDATIYVFDNNSVDGTAQEARRAGAQVLFERRQGKGYVVQSMFRRVEADVYVMVDGDGTYPAASVHSLIAPVLADEADMVVGSRLHDVSRSAFHPLNRLGNRLIRKLLNFAFGARLTDILSGYRAFSRAFVRNVPLFGGGFEIETELTIKALERGWRIVEVPVDLVSRPHGSFSKIRLVHDGLLILNTILSLLRDYKPLTFFGGAGLGLLLLGVLLARASAVAAAGLAVSGLLLLLIGLVVHTISRRFQELDHQLRSLIAERADLANAEPEHRPAHAARSRAATGAAAEQGERREPEFLADAPRAELQPPRPNE